MPFNRVYFPVQAIENHEDFDMWYEDDDLFAHAQSTWESEKSEIEFISNEGGNMAAIKPDYKALTYDLRVGQYRYEMHTYLLFEHYFIKGMLWQAHGNLQGEKYLNFVSEQNDKKEVTIRKIDFRDKGLCYDVRVKELSHLRVAAVAAVAIAVKESYKGLSEGEASEDDSWYKKFQKYFVEKGIPYEELKKQRGW